MKKTILLFFLLISLRSVAQQIMKFQEMEAHGLSVEKLDSVYLNAIHTPTFKGVFPGRKEKKFSDAWGDYFIGLYTYLNENGLYWGAETYCFNKIFFSPDGKVDYWCFNFKAADSIPESVQEKYRELITSYAETHPIGIKAKTKFTQCGSTYFIDVAERKLDSH